ncbi:hypothetical protein Belba_3238 [Belliella baltica DSM 15883]|uniref:Glycosyl/glycerophosphate transferase, teichoic acid biosynthesis n=1 Tax=Belliella baltica (strain DSM 15883 / CIP 108006 / LMG 21964 / BA134) TaxID=866536 RepID=I3Z930_BELBD|nr:hypothetical protein [Belliella baltica]AFL85748.1 hypothetical protein Belba_3238 [Belliella baltica DSM 15883]
MKSENKILFLVSVNSEYPVQAALAKLLRERTKLYPIFCFDSVAHNLYKEVQLCKAEGFTVIELNKSHDTKGINDKSLMTSYQQKYQADNCNNFWKSFQGLGQSFKKVGKLVRNYSKLILDFRQYFRANGILLLVVSNNKHSFNNPYIIKAAHLEGVNVVSLPFGMHSPHSLATKAAKEDILYLHRPVNKLAGFVFPKWKYQKEQLNVLALPGEFLFAMELLDAGPEIPWAGNGGRAGYILTESEYMRDFYLQQGIKEEKLVPTGALYNDVMAEVLNKSKINYQELCRKYRLDVGKPMILTSFPQYLPTFMDNVSEFDSFGEFVKFYADALIALYRDFNVVISIHPRMYAGNFLELDVTGITIAEESIEQLIPLCNFYINCESSTTRWAIACAKPTINYDFYRLNFKIFTLDEGVVTVNTPDEFQKTLYQMSYDNKYFQGLKQRQENLKPRYGLLDGRASERMLDFFGRIVPEGHLRA